MKRENLAIIDELGKFLYMPGKTGDSGEWLPLWMHLIDTWETMRFLLRNRVCESVVRATELDENELLRVCSLAALLHDIGKCTPIFARNILYSIPQHEIELNENGIEIPAEFLHRGKSPHAFAGEVVLRNEGFPDGVCAVVGAHHGKPCSDGKIAIEYERYLESHFKNFYDEHKTV